MDQVATVGRLDAALCLPVQYAAQRGVTAVPIVEFLVQKEIEAGPAKLFFS